MVRDLPSPRRSRRANGSSSKSKSPDAVEHDADYSSGGRNKKLKHEDDADDDPEPVPVQTGGGRGRRKKEKQDIVEPVQVASADLDDAGLDEEEQGVTRCICDEEADTGEFMVQCEKCNVWQHGLCMGFQSEDELWDEYFCEECRPDLHQKTIQTWQAKRKERAGRQSSASHHTSNGHTRHSRSHSPAVSLKQSSKRRNTMNSRDADFDEITKKVMEESAAEAAAMGNPYSNGHTNGYKDLEDDLDPVPSAGRKKRRRPDDESLPSKKRTRSASTASEHPLSSAVTRGDTPAMPPSTRKPSVPILGPPPKGSGRGGKRGGGGRKTTQAEPTPEGEEAVVSAPPAPPKRGWGGRGRGGNRRPPMSHAAQSNDSVRGKASINGPNAGESSKMTRNTHAYAVAQQPLYTSWNLPDYLSHLEPLLPTEIPAPLEVRPSGADGSEKTLERGVKVKWPSKRMSVGDMNKRVRALVEWVGREQANALDRDRRKEALEKAVTQEQNGAPTGLNGHDRMAVDTPQDGAGGQSKALDVPPATGTMRAMEELMEELIRFQERFGPGRNREREKERR